MQVALYSKYAIIINVYLIPCDYKTGCFICYQLQNYFKAKIFVKIRTMYPLNQGDK